MMKKLILAAALATSLGTSAFAQSYDPNIGTGNIAPLVTQNSPNGVFRYPSAAQDSARGAYAQDVTGTVSHARVPRALREPNANVPEAW